MREILIEALFLTTCSLFIIVAGLVISFKRYWLMPISSPSAMKMLKEKKKQASEILRVDDVPILCGARSKAELRAATLLWSKLNNGQKNTYVKTGEFIVFTHRGMFRIAMGGRVTYRTPSGNWRSFCILLVQDHDLPPSDKVLSFKLAAEADTNRFLLTGNIGG